MPSNKSTKTKFKLENKDDTNQLIGISITIDFNHKNNDIDRLMESMTSTAKMVLQNYQDETIKPKKQKNCKISNVV